MRIHLLNQEVISHIAAGEIILSSASIVKELIENSIDANASRISINIQENNNIVVEDNGDGIHIDDLKLAIQQYTTSKEINNLTLGFRGEALFAINHLTNLIIISNGYKLENNNIHACASNPGTKVIINGFTEFSIINRHINTNNNHNLHAKIYEIIASYVLAYENIQISLKINRKNHIISVQNIYEKYFSNSSIHEFKSTRIDGKIYIGHRDRYFLFINSRPIKDREIVSIVRKTYEKICGISNVSFLLKINMDPQAFSVNIHPRKEDVVLHDDSILQEIAMAIGCSFHHQTIKNDDQQIYLTMNKEVVQIFDRYLFYYDKDEVIVMDQHAAHERIVTENILKRTFNIQQLIQPKVIFCSQEIKNLLDTSDKLHKYFDYDIFDACIILKGIPDFLPEESIDMIFSNLHDDPEILIYNYFHNYGCKNSIKSGDPVSIEEALNLLIEIKQTQNGLICNHGRKTYVTFSKSQIDGFFGRR